METVKIKITAAIKSFTFGVGCFKNINNNEQPIKTFIKFDLSPEIKILNGTKNKNALNKNFELKIIILKFHSGSFKHKWVVLCWVFLKLVK